MRQKKFPVLCTDDVCSGCLACVNACPQNAIEIIQNAEGFYRPNIIDSKCVCCLLCEKSCPVLYNPITYDGVSEVFAAWHKDDYIRQNSSSGGAFSALAESVLAQGGVIVGATYSMSPGLRVHHAMASTKEDLAKLRLSKYVQSNIGFIFREIKRIAVDGKKVLFCGTPCQAAGLKAYLKKEYDNIIICDFICHGVPSPYMLDKYVEWLEYKIGCQNEINFINFRDKRKGWYDALRVITLDNSNKVKVLRGILDSYWIGFNENKNLQYACYNCHFLGRNRNSDITIADFWGIGKNKPFEHKDQIEKGVSMIMPNSDKGMELVQQSRHNLELFSRDISEIMEYNKAMLHSSTMPEVRKTFYKDLISMDYDIFLKKYLTPGLKTRVVKFLREYFPYKFISALRLKNQK